jgi:hypothetical protein
MPGIGCCFVQSPYRLTNIITKRAIWAALSTRSTASGRRGSVNFLSVPRWFKQPE